MLATGDRPAGEEEGQEGPDRLTHRTGPSLLAVPFGRPLHRCRPRRLFLQPPKVPIVGVQSDQFRAAHLAEIVSREHFVFSPLFLLVLAGSAASHLLSSLARARMQPAGIPAR
jgi:hypothetical protein